LFTCPILYAKYFYPAGGIAGPRQYLANKRILTCYHRYSQTNIPALPYCAFTLKAKRSLPLNYPQYPKTIGEHIKKRRMDLKLLQKDLAKKLGTTGSSIVNWETNKTYPTLIYMPRIVDFLGYWPYDPKIKTLGQRIKRARKFRSLTQESLARIIEVDPSTVANWERDEKKASEKLFERLNCFYNNLAQNSL